MWLADRCVLMHHQMHLISSWLHHSVVGCSVLLVVAVSACHHPVPYCDSGLRSELGCCRLFAFIVAHVRVVWGR